MERNHHARFIGHAHCNSRNTMVLVLSRDFTRPRDQRIINCEFMSGSSLWSVITLPRLIAMSMVVVWKYNGFSLSRDSARPHDQRVM